MGLDARLVSFAFVCLSISFCFYFLLQKLQVMIIFCDLKKTWEERKRPLETRTMSMKSITGGQACSCPSTT